jgi:nucleotide sugar dehydrogenase
MKYNIGIIGQGFVGNAIYQKFKNYFEVATFDLDETKRNTETIEEVVNLSDVVFVCVPTPMKRVDGSCDISIVESVLKELNEVGKPIVAVIKSTIPPTTTEMFNKNFKNLTIVFNPEFLTEANAVQDFENQSKIILGGPRNGTTPLKQIYRLVFPTTPIIKTGSTHAEMVKYLTNTFLATKVSFANEIYQVCDKLGLDYDKVVEYATYDERLGKSHWSVPGPDGDLGFGGHCFPKDVKALIYLAEELELYPTMLRATDKKNNVVRKNRDWEKMKGRAVS